MTVEFKNKSSLGPNEEIGMSWSIFLTAIGLLCVFEGIMPFLSPRVWRQIVLVMSTQSDRTLRIIGLSSMLIGLLFVSIARELY